MSNQTIRELINEVQSEIRWSIAHEHTIKRSGQLWIEDRLKAALDLLDNAAFVTAEGPWHHHRIVPDPAPRGDTDARKAAYPDPSTGQVEGPDVL